MYTLRGADQPTIPEGRSRVGVDLRFEELVEEESRQPERLFARGGLRRDPLLEKICLARFEGLDAFVEHPEVGGELKCGGGASRHSCEKSVFSKMIL